MKTILSEKLPRILKNKTKLEKELNLKITNRGKEINIEGEPEDEYFGEKVIIALNFGFPYSSAISIKTEEKEFEILNIKDYARTKDLSRVRARIIGKKGRGIQTISALTKCNIELNENRVGIIGDAECIKNAIEAISSLTKGAKHSNVYSFLEKHQIQPVFDFGLKEEKKKK
ncbi:MAG: KH domain-containing protein [Candidatus Pacearchaeota archaeon]|jgi:ribosomal RNA assembly protein